jgi:hypothetical protein
MKNKVLLVPQKIGIALLAVLLTFAVGLCVSTSANAKQGKTDINGCTYTVNDFNYRTTAQVTGGPLGIALLCGSVTAHIVYRSGGGTLYDDKGPETHGTSQTGQVLSPCIITSNYADAWGTTLYAV